MTAGRLRDRVAIVTGGSSGIGRAVALRLAEEGARIIVNYARNREAALEVVSNIEAKGGQAVAACADVRDRTAVASMVADALVRFGQIDVLVNNAGIEVVAPIMDLQDEQLDALIDVHLKGTLHCSQLVAPHMQNRRCGRIVNVSSIASLGTAVCSIAGYAVVKAAVNMLTKRLACELGPFNVLVNAVSPGTVNTPMLESISGRSAEFRDFSENLSKRVLLGRFGEPQEIASVIAFLASDDASYMTGQILSVDGGRTDLLSRST